MKHFCNETKKLGISTRKKEKMTINSKYKHLPKKTKITNWTIILKICDRSVEQN